MAGFLERLLAPPAPKAGTPAPQDDFWYGPVDGGTASGAYVTADSALRETAVYACVGLLAETVASLPLVVYRRGANGTREVDRAHPLFPVLHGSPNGDHTAFEFWEMLMVHLLLRGNAYAEIIAGRRGAIDRLVPLHPDYVKVERLPNGRRAYEVRDPKGKTAPRRLVQDEVLHVRNRSTDGLVGLSPITLAREQVGLSMVLQRHAAKFFANNAQPRGAIKTPGALDDEAIARMRKSWNDVYGGVENSSKVAILEQGLEYQAISLSNEDSQFLESRKFQVAEIARLFRVPPHMIGDTERSTSWGTGIEQQTIGFINYALRPWLERIEQAVHRDLFIGPWRLTHFAEANLDGLLRGDFPTRMDGFMKMMQSGIGIPNELRAKENLPPYPGGDRPWRPSNMVAVGPDGRAIVDSAAATSAMILDAAGRPMEKRYAA